MKTNEKSRNNIARFIVILLLLTMIFGLNSVKAAEFKPIEKSAEFEEWESLSENEKNNSIQPSYYGIDLKESIRRSNYNQMLRSLGGTVEASYNLKDYISINNKNQQATGLCWAFSFSSMLETTLSKCENKNVEYSPTHLSYTCSKMFKLNVGEGANYWLATAYCTSGRGPVLEREMPFNNYYDETKNSSATYYLTSIENAGSLEKEVNLKINDTTIFPNINKKCENGTIKYYQSDSTTEYTAAELRTIRNLIKQHIKEYGAITATMYSDIKINQNGQYSTSYYDEEKYSYFCNDDTNEANHAITIVGWDDNYAIDNFRSDCRPSSPGAYIILNSYGTEFGENGYMYISYEDLFIESMLMGVNNLREGLDYDKIYQYDELGVNQSIGTGSTSIYGGAKFTRNKETEKREYLNEIGLDLLDTEGIEIYLNNSNDDINEAELIYSSEKALETGYHCIKLASPIELTGEKFAIKVKYINQEGATLPIESNLKDSGFTWSSNYYDTATSSDQSFFSLDGGTWRQLNGTKVGSFVTLADTDTCIKAFTTFAEGTPTISVTGVTLDKTVLNIENGNTQSLIATVAPNNATNKNVTWSSSNTSVATVAGGVVTAKSKGEVTITVTTEDGEKIATCKVTVTEAQPEVVTVQEISLNKSTVTLEKGKTETLTATIAPNNATNKNVTWSSSNASVATVAGGVVTAKAKGEATITATTEDGEKTAICNVTVTEQQATTVSVEKIVFDKLETSIQVGDTTNLVVSFNPSNASNKNVTWSSSNTNVATITQRGIITAVSEGKTTIKAISEDGNKEATCELTVVKKTNTDDDIYTDDDANKKQEPSNTNKGDDTVANKELPNTGVTLIVIVLLTGIIVFSVIKFIKFKDLKDIK